jgi:L-asparagine oxygenase
MVTGWKMASRVLITPPSDQRPNVPHVVAQWPDLAPHIPRDESADFVRAAGYFGRLLPAEVHDALVDFADAPPSVGAVRLSGVPVGLVPPTPPRPDAAVAKDRISEFALLAIGRRLGQPMGWREESGGALTPNIVPTTTETDRQVSTSSSVDLVFHTEGSYAHHRPRYLVILCLRGDPGAATTLAPLRSMLEHLDDAAIGVLSQPRFAVAVDETYVQPGQRPLTAPFAAITPDPDHPRMVFDADLMVGLDDEAQIALEQLSTAAVASRIDVVLEAGDALVIDNHLAAHGRSAFTPRFDGTDRWLQRCFVMADPSISDGRRQGRVIDSLLERSAN